MRPWMIPSTSKLPVKVNLGCWQIHWCDLSCEAYPQEQNESQKTELNKADSRIKGHYLEAGPHLLRLPT